MKLTEIIANLEAIASSDAVYCQSSISEGKVLIEADKKALVELATDMLKMANKEYFKGMHQHFDETNFLEEPSIPLIVVRNESLGNV